ncbi:hypothetical protein VNI00_004629 [Paramarasmius palmivorus]|uniref:Uncharacterized protein n=1 Tax=Paramarasmius palmivorus TaxID=297713 RepID=A0AAW0DHY6_9AGAR
MSTTSTTPPPTYTSEENQEKKENAEKSREGEGEALNDGGSSPKHSGGDRENGDKNSSRSLERSRSHRHRHRHAESPEAGPSTPRRSSGSDEVVDDDKKSTKSHHSRRHHNHHDSRSEERGKTEASSLRNAHGHNDGDTKSTKSHRSHSRREDHGHRDTSSSRSTRKDHDEETMSTKSREKHRSHHHHEEPNTTTPAPAYDNDDNKSSVSTKTPEKSKHTRDDNTQSEKRELSPEDIERLRQDRVRHSRVGTTELLKELARNGVPQDLDTEGLPKFRVITGTEARSIFNDVLREDESRVYDQKRSLSIGKERPIVFAFPHHPPNPALKAGRGVVDFYLHHLKRKTGTNRLKGGRRKTGFLDGELDEGLMKIKQSIDNLAQKRLSASPAQKSTGENPRPAITATQSAPAAIPTTAGEPLLPPKRPSISSRHSNPSVLSLPYLGATNVDLRTPFPLRVTNPDPASSSGSDSKRSSLVDTVKPSEKRLGRTLSVVEEAEPKSEKRHRHNHHRKHGLSGSSDSASTSASSSSSKERRKKEEILIVLMDSDNEVDRSKDRKRNDKLKRSNSARTPRRMASTRNSPWDGPVATSHGEVHRYVPGASNYYARPSVYYAEDSDETESDDDDDEDASPISMKTALKALGYYNSNSTPHLPATQHQLPTPALPQPMLPSISSPYRPVTQPQIYDSPHIYSNSTPNLPLPQVPGVASSYVTPWVSSVAGTPLVHPAGSLPAMDHPAASLYSSPYIKPAQAPYPYSNSASGTPNSKRELPLQIYASPAGTGAGAGATPRTSASPYASGTGGGHIPLPAIAIYSPYVRPAEASGMF